MSLVIQHDISLKPFNTFGMAVRARHFCHLTAAEQLPELLRLAEYRNGPVLWLGGGSNVLFTRDFDGLVVKLDNKGIRQLEADADHVIVEAAAGEIWHDFVCHSLQQGWYGLENLSLIPGTVGASPVQNIGAYGVEVKDAIHEVVCADLQRGGEIVVLSNADCRFGYRDSLFKHAEAGRWLVLAVRFRLARRASLHMDYGDIRQQLESMGVSQPTAQDVSRAIIHIRSTKLPNPAELGNAGSFFKNPVVSAELAETLIARYPALPHYPAGPGQVKLAAGWLIDQAGFKGCRHGDAGVHARQALVLVNYGAASGEQIWQLANDIRQAVWERYQVQLEPEPVVL